MPAFPALLDTSLRVTDAIYYGQSSNVSSTSVPLTRTIATTAPLTGGGDLSADRTFALTTSPAGQTPVGVTRLITATAPITIDATTSADLSANRTIAVGTFAGVAAGVVPSGSGNDPAKFLSGAGTWLSGTVTGVSSITGVAPVLVSPTTGAVFISCPVFTSITGGTVPQTGGAAAGDVLHADGTWGAPGLGAYVTLQGSSPGTADTGHVHVSGTIYSDEALVAQRTATGGLTLGTHGASIAPVVDFENSRGTLASPSALLDADDLASLRLKIAVGATYTTKGWIYSRADGNQALGAANVTDIVSGSAGSLSQLRHSALGLRIYGGAGSLAVASVRALHALDLQGSLGLYGAAKTTTYVQTQNDCVLLLDATGGAWALTLLTASVANAGKTLILSRTDATVNALTITGTISGIVNPLISPGDTWVIYSNGTSWFMLSKNEKTLQSTNATSATAINTTTSKSYFDQNVGFRAMPELASMSGRALIRYRAYGLITTKGSAAGTLRFFANCVNGGAGNQDYGSTRATTMSDGMTSMPWHLEAEFMINPVSNVLMTHGVVSVRDDIAGVDKTMAMTRALPLFNSTGATTLNVAVQWSVSDVSNSIICNYQSLVVDRNAQF